MKHFYGDWINEMRNEEVLLPQGIHRIESKLETRATNFDLPSFLLSVDKPATEDEGTVIADTLAWSGNFKSFMVSTTILLHIIWPQAKNLRHLHSSIPLRRKVKVKQVVIYTNGLWTTVSIKVVK
ncbi:glycoside hydrolase family 36 N-terminal domain-containing protein [Sphingobacterium cavernae]|uniref:glycoside hydrolase family 36 N-terminal domain-containing protein n=1 Tax=Sphingobacterium cavernae TaxID=2592657 RepID=UPI0021D334F9|nr:glycoside hydrolase family 36 N-terminal domain-containing protein [Sphingobacterium cavernae]